MKRKKWGKQGNIFLGIVIAILIWFYGILFLSFITDTITGARGDLNCSLTTITGGTMMTCLLLSGLTPYFIWFIISAALGYVIGGRL